MFFTCVTTDDDYLIGNIVGVQVIVVGARMLTISALSDIPRRPQFMHETCVSLWSYNPVMTVTQAWVMPTH